jgi:hypothetical protein
MDQFASCPCCGGPAVGTPDPENEGEVLAWTAAKVNLIPDGHDGAVVLRLPMADVKYRNNIAAGVADYLTSAGIMSPLVLLFGDETLEKVSDRELEKSGLCRQGEIPDDDDEDEEDEIEEPALEADYPE